ncbi:MAG: matrixin family metalloprotease [Gemmatimonadetes bacterium]|nr:matrixin family metalloprotease [Gemmatimonadota bacterium]
MRRLLQFLIVTVLVMACSDIPQEPTVASGDLHARLTSPPDLSGILPELERRVFIHYRPGYARPEGRGKPGGGNGGSSCFSLLANGAKWKTIEPYRTSFASLPVATWEFNNEIFGPSESGPIPGIEKFGELDSLNTAQFGPYPEPNVIAVTVVWGVFRGPPRQRKLVEWDMLMNSDFSWGDADLDPAVMDTLNIAAHELGHAAGLGHPPDECTDETMYAFAEFGETKKRDLAPGDIAGILELY